jgi:uncharacterized protein (DUF1800 family)
MVGTIRILEMKQVNYGFVDNALDTMGQTLYQPPNVGGWEEGRAWISANRILLRYNAVADLVDQSQLDVAQTLEGKVSNTAELINYLATACLACELTDAQRQALADYVGTLPPPAEWSQHRAELNDKLRGLLALLMSTPEYQLN